MSSEATLRILLCSPKKHIGGISKWTNNILDHYKNHCRTDLDIEWFYPGVSEKECIASTPFFQRIINAWKTYFPLLVQIENKIDTYNPDIVHFSTSASLGLFRDYIILSICNKKYVATVLHYHFGRIPQLINSNSWEGRLLRKVANKASVNIVLDRPSFEAMRSAGYNNVEILPNPLSNNVRDLVDKYKCIQVEPRSIVFVGHMVESKGIYELVEACRSIPNVKVHMLGSVASETKERLLALGGEGSSEWLDIAGVKPFDEVIKCLVESELFVLPTYSEGFPNVIIESMACGKPTVSTPVGAIADMLDVEGDNPCGVCVPVRNVVALREAITNLLNNKEKTSVLGANAKSKVEAEYNMNKVFDRLVGIWNKYKNEYKK